MPGGANCAGQICCPPGAEVLALAELMGEWGWPEPIERRLAMSRDFFRHFDAVPKGWWPQCVAAIKKLQAEDADG